MLSYNPNKRTSQVAAGPSIGFWRDALGSDRQLPLYQRIPMSTLRMSCSLASYALFMPYKISKARLGWVTHVTIALFCCLSFAMDS